MGHVQNVKTRFYEFFTCCVTLVENTGASVYGATYKKKHNTVREDRQKHSSLNSKQHLPRGHYDFPPTQRHGLA